MTVDVLSWLHSNTDLIRLTISELKAVFDRIEESAAFELVVKPKKGVAK